MWWCGEEGTLSFMLRMCVYAYSTYSGIQLCYNCLVLSLFTMLLVAEYLSTEASPALVCDCVHVFLACSVGHHQGGGWVGTE